MYASLPFVISAILIFVNITLKTKKNWGHKYFGRNCINKIVSKKKWGGFKFKDIFNGWVILLTRYMVGAGPLIVPMHT